MARNPRNVAQAAQNRNGTKGYHMSGLYGPIHRALQERFDTRRLADNVENRVVLPSIPPEHKAFIESRDMFFLSTVDHQGRPTVSHKGGDPGFVRVSERKNSRVSLLRRQRHVLFDGQPDGKQPSGYAFHRF